MSPEIQEWSHKSRSRINNLYLLTRPIILTTLVLINFRLQRSNCLVGAYFLYAKQLALMDFTTQYDSHTLAAKLGSLQ